ncbi:hypothetical protein AFK68_06975 [Hydrocoleum sp. CS-953]|uniref:hypothetical protein n=1 Tax=Hydrocoleum sp. CS-953 TaxID=1671698 RepID=UPI000B9A2190|nr:hypothetical protein [Hydrocoleum sp. CS-953]OZH55059.1 hypothetical protein AFK68_06975 [Hydrocoleum sp. CS-953]
MGGWKVWEVWGDGILSMGGWKVWEVWGDGNLYHVRLNSYTLEEGRQRAEGRRQKGKKSSKGEGFFIIDYPDMILDATFFPGLGETRYEIPKFIILCPLVSFV